MAIVKTDFLKVSNDVGSFLDAVMKHAITNSEELAKEFTADMTAEYAKNTPIDTGLAKGNWVAKLNNEPAGFSREFDKTKTGSKAKKKALKKLAKLSIKDTAYVKNGVVGGKQSFTKSGRRKKPTEFTEDGYILKLEDGTSPKAPTGFFRKTNMRAKQIIKKSKRKLGLKRVK